MKYAESLLLSGKIKKVLVVVGDELDQTMLRISDLWFDDIGEKPPRWGEGATAFLLEKKNFATATFDEPESSFDFILESSASVADSAKRVFGDTLLNDAFATAIMQIQQN
jgi:3-oxoacyl-[acyl-carrier-protein] synthase III